MSEKERNLIAKTHETFGTCLTAERLRDDFQKLGITYGMTLLVHCSLSKIGWICGGAVTIIQVLLDILGPHGTLIMPSHTADNSDPKHRINPFIPLEWFDTVRQSIPGYQSDITPTFRMGKVSETFRHWPGVVRSQHPLYSVIALGEKAQLITDHHYDACGEQSPLARLYDCTNNGYVLLLGVQHKNNTSLHLAEYRFQINENAEKKCSCGAAVINPETNKREWIEWMDYDYCADDFIDVGKAFDSIDGNTKLGKVGLAECRLIKQHLLVDFAVDWMTKNRLIK
ncbi:hypothetical protein I4U23_019925 [Adineta vaga]|nr:hypothetical protein I4U23_019925 [Adineta vaga]